MPERPTLVLEGEKPNGTARVLHTVLNEKLDEAPWKAKPVKALSNRTVRLLITDRNEWVDVVVGSNGTVDVRSGSPGAPDTKPQVTVALDMRTLPVILGIPLWHKLPALWEKGGKKLLTDLAGRRVRVRGLLSHPAIVIRVLQILGVPPGTVG
ncbi:MAG TPA: hypothetical protein VGR20_14430 [Acidimicrobiia bacterium]|jgi:hypothetical protein|nr:hypothetical protein [Acidimicrobiia bacterium]